MKTALTVVLLLVVSNTFMTLAWYGHLKFRHGSLLITIVLSWLIALPEYSFQVPANRLGYGHFSATQLKVIQEAVSLTVFIVFALVYLDERPTWRSLVAFLLVLAAVALVNKDTRPAAPPPGGPDANRSDGPTDPV
jgi:uncharacterized protein (DUF486 family)